MTQQSTPPDPPEEPMDGRGHTHRHPTGSPFYHDECDITDRDPAPPDPSSGREPVDGPAE